MILRIISLLFVSVLNDSRVLAKDLLEIYELALLNDPQIKAAQARRDAVLQSKPQSIARLLPSISANGQYDRIRSDNKSSFVAARSGTTEQFWQTRGTIDLRQALFNVEFWVQLGQADNQIAQSEAEYAAEHQNLIVRTSRAYFDVLSAQDSLEFATAEKIAIARQLDQAKQRFEVGLIAITDVHEAQAGFDQARADEIAALNELDNAKEGLLEIIGDDSADLSPLGEVLPLDLPAPDDINEWSLVAEIQNLNIIAAKNQTEVTRKNIKLQRAGHFPRIDLVAQYGYNDDTRAFGVSADTQSLGVQLNVPIFEGGAVNSRSQQAHHEYQAAREDLERQRREVKRQVRNAYRGVLSTVSQVKALQATLVSSRSALEATEAGFEVGTRTMVDVLSEQRNLFSVKRDYSRTRYDYIVNRLLLKQAASSLSQADLDEMNEYFTKPLGNMVAPETFGKSIGK